VSVALVVVACYNPTVVKTNVLCSSCLCIAIVAARFIDHLVNRLVARPATVAVAAVATATAVGAAAVTAAAIVAVTAAAAFAYKAVEYCTAVVV
jgi:hypothetical protein